MLEEHSTSHPHQDGGPAKASWSLSHHHMFTAAQETASGCLNTACMHRVQFSR